MAEYDADEFGKYTSLSNLAVCSLVLSLFSPLAFLSPLLLVVPVAAMICAGIAIGQVRSSSGSLSGANLAYAALAIGIICAVASVVRVQVRDYHYRTQADRVTREWLELLIADRAIDSIEMLSGSAKHQLFPPPAPGEPSAPFNPEVAAERLSGDTLTTYLSDHADLGEIGFELLDFSSDTSARNPRAVVNYRVDVPECEPATLSVVLTRIEGPGMPAAWLVDTWNIEGADVVAHDHHHGHHHGHHH